MSTNASAGGPVGTSITDTATLAGGAVRRPGRSRSTCTGQTIQLLRHPGHHDQEVSSGNGDYTSDSQTPIQAGDYSWTASYDGDGNNNGVSRDQLHRSQRAGHDHKGQPNADHERVGWRAVGTSITDTATLAGGASTPTGTITFNLYGPNDPNCTGTPVTTTKTVTSGNGDYTSTRRPQPGRELQLDRVLQRRRQQQRR